jgi:uncharacterized protein (DUF58 family)
VNAGPSGTAPPPPRPLSVRATPDLWHHLGLPALFAALAWFFRQELVFLLGALVVGCALAAAPLARRNLRWVTVTRRVPQRARVGVPTSVEVRLRNDGPETAVGLEVQQAHPRLAQPATGRLAVPGLGAGHEVAGQVPLLFLARGRQTVAGATLKSRFPLGAFRSERETGPDEVVLVWPREGRPTGELLRRLLGGGPALLTQRTRTKGADDLVGVREWREGDDPRRVHAPSSARRGETLVTDWRALPGRETLVVLGRCAGAAPGALFERGVSVTATLWTALARARRPARLLVGGDAVGGSAGLGHAAGLDRLALARPRETPTLRARLEALAARPAPRQVVVVGGPEDAALLEIAKRAAGPSGHAWLLDVRPGSSERWVKGLET